MHSLDEAVGLRMVGGRHDQFDAPKTVQLSEEIRRELGSSVCRYRRRNPEMLHPTVAEGVCDRLGGDVSHWDGYWPSREAIHGC